ncbi:Karyopherin Sal3 [Paramicrosporidium saccamoebae]|uniref:Karyopherin Sal3 n=1 Tax=Paramicrosporidium saccamoebae TaxID=1246581 RepID=A0A2H9TLL2_9FUNG|nr:Karyopherin Sal3 [Paramicrosporidium saccamoebae]
MITNEAVAQLQQILVGLSSSDNSIREKHEQAFEQNWISQPEVLFPSLCMVITMDQTPTSRSLAAIILRRVLGKSIPAPTGGKNVRLWSTLSADAQKNCGETLLNSWKGESVKEVRNKISDAIAEVARIVNLHEEWPQLLTLIWSVDVSQPSELIESSLRILAAVPECIQNQKGELVASYLIQFFNHAEVQVQLAAVKALCAVVSVSSDDKKQAYANIVNGIPNILAAFAQASAEEALTDCIQSIVEMADDCPKLFRPQATRLAPVLCAITDCKEGQFEDDTRSVALELLTTLVEVIPGTFKKQKELTGTVVILILKMISSGLDDGQEWYQITPDDEFEEEDLSLTAEAALDRVAIALGGKTLLPSLMSSIPGMIRSSEWKHRYGALRAIANMAEGCADLLEDRLEELLGLVWPSFKDAHPRVQYAACHALGQLCTDFAGPLQEHFAQQCLASLVGVLVSSNQPRVQCHAAAALINFAEGVDSAIISPVLDGLLDRLVSLLGTSTLYLQEQVIASMAAFSSASGVSFSRFLPQVIPLLMNCLTSNLDKSYRQLQCRALEAVTMVALAVGKEHFRPYSQPLLDVMVKLQQAEHDSDDLILDYLAPSWVRICQVLETEFSPFIPLVLPRLLSDAAADPDIAVIDAANPTAEDDYDPNEWEFATIRGRRLGIHTATLDNKCAAVENLAVYIATLQKDFAPFAEQTFSTVLPLVSFTMHEGVQSASVEALASLIKVVYEAGKPSNLATVKSMTQQSLTAMLSQLQESGDSEVLVSILDAMADICNISSGEILPEGLLYQSFDAINALLTILMRSQSRSSAQVDEDEEDDEEKRAEDDENVMYGITRLAAALFKCFKEASLAPSETLLKFCLGCIMPGKSGLLPHRHAALCILDDLVHWLGVHTFPIRDHVAQSFAKGLVDEDPDNRQAAVFGVGMCSEHAPSVYEQFCRDSKAPSVITVTDNAMSAVARICQAYGVDLKTVLPIWITGLPVTHDEAEAPTVYKWLLTLLGNGDISVTDEQGTHILRALVEVLVKNCIADPTLKNQIKSAAASLQQQLSPDLTQSAISGFTPEQLAKLSQ